MKTKKHSKKNQNTRRNPGRIVLDENTIENFLVLKRETAFQQLMDAMCKFNEDGDMFIADLNCFDGHEEELGEVMEKVHRFMAIRARIYGTPSLVNCTGNRIRVA